jgi:acyl carrier protein
MFDLATLLDLLKNALPTLDTAAVDPAKPLAQQGVDSLDLANLLLLVEEATTIRIPDEDVERLATASDIVEYINAKTPRG